MRLRPGYLVRIKGYRHDENFPDKATKGDVGIIMGSDTEDIGIKEHPFFTVRVEDGADGSYQDGFWTEELWLVCDGKTSAQRPDQNNRSD